MPTVALLTPDMVVRHLAAFLRQRFDSTIKVAAYELADTEKRSYGTTRRGGTGQR